jgi:hypothetical protein
MTSYDRQAQQFLNQFNLTIHAERVGNVGNDCPPWCEGKLRMTHGDQYLVSVMDKSEERDSFSFDFWSRLRDEEKGDPPSEYDILVCLSTEIEAEPMGESEKVLEVLNELTRNATGFFTTEELQALRKIS